MLATILKQAVGLDSFRAFDEWFARPMRMQDFDPNACRELSMFAKVGTPR